MFVLNRTSVVNVRYLRLHDEEKLETRSKQLPMKTSRTGYTPTKVASTVQGAARKTW